MVESNTKDRVNKDLILRENLAIQRTLMANDRTLLSFIRTSLYFSVAGLTINSFVDIRYGRIVEIGFWMLAAGVLVIGILKYRSSAKKIRESRQHIGNYVLDNQG